MNENKIVKIQFSKMKQLNKWISNLIYPGKIDNFIQVTKSFKKTIEGEEQIDKEFCFYTNEFKYKIFARDREKDDGYLDCVVTARKMRAGEDWNRGNYLADGSFNEETWQRILNTIINYELVQLSQYKPTDTPEDIA